MEFFAILAPIFLLIGVGATWGRIFKVSESELKNLVNLTLFVFVPSLIFVSVSKVQILEVGSIFLAALFVVLGVGAISYVASKLTCLGDESTRALAMSSMFMNAGSLGSSIAYLAFGSYAFVLASMFYLTVQALLYTAGVLIASKKGKISITYLKPMFSTPLLFAFVAGVALNGAAMPETVTKPLDMLSRAAVPMLLLTLGIQLAKIKVTRFNTKVSAMGAGIRICAGFLLALIFTSIFGIDGVLKSVILVSSSMPTAITAFVVCSKFRCGIEQMSTSLLFSYAASAIVIPLVLLAT